MRIINEKMVGGRPRVVVELDPGETLIALRPEGFYQLGGQVGDVMPAHVLLDAVPVAWDHFSQEWVE